MMIDRESLSKKETAENISLVFVNGVYAEELSDTRLLPAEMLRKPYNADEIEICLPKDYVVPVPVHILFIGAHADFARSFCYKLIAGPNSEIVLIEEYASREIADTSIVVAAKIIADKNAKIHYYKILNNSALTAHMSNMIIDQKQDSRVQAFYLMEGTEMIQQDVQVNLLESGAECELYGLAVLNRNKQKFNHYINIDHVASHTASKMVFKAVLENKSFAGFKGKVFVHENAQHINAHQENHNLLLTANAEVSTKPELEIYADDVKCTHGATVGQLDEEALFFLRSRGIAKADALKMLTQGFTAEIFSAMKDEAIKSLLQQRMNNYEKL